MRDGIRLSANVFLPRAPGRYPVILQRTPYESLAGHNIEWGVWWAQRGYAAVVQDVRGRYASEGVFYPYVHEAEDGHDTIDWLAGQPWCTGRVGTWGRSYGALVQWLAAPLGNPHLACMAPHVIMDDYFLDYHYIGGAFQLALALGVAIIWTTNTTITQAGSAELFNNRRVLRSLPLLELDVAAVGHEIRYYRDWLRHGVFDEYWRSLNTAGRHSRIEVPVFQQCGWFDPYVDSTFRNWQAMSDEGATQRAREGQLVLIGPWSHEEPVGTTLGDADFGPASLLALRGEERRWFDHWLKEDGVGRGDEAPLRYFVMGRNEWRWATEWPPRESTPTAYYLHSAGRANSLNGDGTLSLEPPGTEPADRFVYDPENPVFTLGGNNSIEYQSRCAEEPIVPGPVDQRPLERRDDVLVYTSAPLERELEVTGPLEVVLYAASDARDTDFTARLVDVDPSGRALNLAEGIVRARFRRDYANAELLEPGEPAEYRIRLNPTSNVFRRGHCIRLDISSSNFPRFSRNLNTGEDVATGTRIRVARQTVLHSPEFPSHVLLPVVDA
jgi:uncharacterized protein